MKISIIDNSGPLFDIEIREDATVFQLKAEIASQRSLDQSKLLLIYNDRVLADNQQLS